MLQSKKKILLCVTGGIATYKALELLRLLKTQGFSVHVAMTKSAMQFVSPLSFQTLSNEPVATSLFDLEQESKIGHISLSQSSNLILVVPATANIIGKFANGIADDLISTILLASNHPIYFAPAMNDVMWKQESVQTNVTLLKQQGIQFISPESGFLACGTNSIGRLAKIETIFNIVLEHFLTVEATSKNKKKLSGISVLITAGPTIEPIDPVRYLTNYSSGKMGYAIADICLEMGANVTLISGPSQLNIPKGCNFIPIKTTEEMHKACLQYFQESRLIFKVAAVSDYKPSKVISHKQKKEDTWNLNLIKTIDILKELGKKKQKRQYLVGFAAESEKVECYAKDKLNQKNLDMIVANNILEKNAGFHSDTNIVTIFDHHGKEQLPLLSKHDVARKILARILSQSCI